MNYVKVSSIVVFLLFSPAWSLDWTIQTVDTDGGAYCSLALDNLGIPHISYQSFLDLRYASYNGTSWDITTADSGIINAPANHTSLDFDSQNRPHISYWARYKLNHATYNGSSWEIHTRTGDGNGYFTSLDIDSQDRSHIIYNETGANSGLKYIINYDGIWHPPQVVQSELCEGLSMSLDYDDIPHISYYAGDLR